MLSPFLFSPHQIAAQVLPGKPGSLPTAISCCCGLSPRGLCLASLCYRQLILRANQFGVVLPAGQDVRPVSEPRTPSINYNPIMPEVNCRCNFIFQVRFDGHPWLAWLCACTRMYAQAHRYAPMRVSRHTSAGSSVDLDSKIGVALCCRCEYHQR